jgi:HK97 family phage major capsid protein
MELYIVQIKKVNIMSDNLNVAPDDQALHQTIVKDISSEVAQKMSPIIESVSAIAEVVKSQSEDMKNMCDSIKSLSDIIAEEKKSNAQKSRKIGFGNRETVHITSGDDINVEECVKTYNDCMKSLVNGFGTDHNVLENAKNNILKSHLQRKMQEKGFKSVYNSFNPEQGGFALQNPVFAGTFDSNPIQYPNIIDYVGTLTAIGGMVGEKATYVGIDSDELDVYETQELAESGQSGMLKLSSKEFTTQKFTTSYRLTTEIKDLVDQGSLNFDLIATIETRMQTALRRKLANRVVNALKNAVADQEDQAKGKIGKLTMGTGGKVSIKNLFDIYDQLRERYIENNPIFFCNANFANALAQEVGDNGQLITSSMMNIRNLGRGSFELTWAGNVLTIVTIPTKTPTRFDDYNINGGNASKLLGIFGDMQSLFKVSYKGLPPSKREVINKLVDSDGVYIVHDRMNIADGILETKAGYGIVCG